MPPKKAAPRRSGRHTVKEEPPSEPENTGDFNEVQREDMEMQSHVLELTLLSQPLGDSAPEPSTTTQDVLMNDRPSMERITPTSTTAVAHTPPISTPKFKPKAGRRTKEAREADERAEAERRAQRAAEASLNRGLIKTDSTNRGRSGLSGNMSSRPFANERKQLQEAAGPWGGGQTIIRPTPRTRGGKTPSAPRAQSNSGVAGDTTTKTEGAVIATTEKKPRRKKLEAQTGSSKATASRAKPKSHPTEIIYLSSDDSGVEGQRVNIEQINLVSSDEDPDSDDDPIPTTSTKRHKPHREASSALRPVRVERHEHVSRVAGLTVKPRRSASAETKEAPQAKEKQDVETIASDGEASKDSDLEFIRSDARSETGRGKARQADITVREDIEVEEDTAKPKARGARKVHFQHLDAVETVEEREEQERREEAVKSLKEELVSMAAITTGSDGADMVSGRNGNLYLFQFPPLTPMLFDNKKTTNGETAADGHVSAPTTARNDTISQSKEGKSGSSGIIKKEEGAEKSVVDDRSLTAIGQKLPEGKVGKLKVHKSGRVSLEWGGVDMEMEPGAEVDFLQDALLTTSAGETDNIAWSMSQIKRKVVVTPSWEKLFES